MDSGARRLAALSVVGIGAFASPVLWAFNQPPAEGAIPLLPAYLFVVWGFLVLVALIVEKLR